MTKRHYVLILQVGIVITTMLVILFKIPSLPPQIPLFYSLSVNSGRVVDSYLLAVLPISIVVFLVFNLLVLKKVFKNDEFVANILYVVNNVLIVVCALICLKILLLVT